MWETKNKLKVADIGINHRDLRKNHALGSQCIEFKVILEEFQKNKQENAIYKTVYLNDIKYINVLYFWIVVLCLWQSTICSCIKTNKIEAIENMETEFISFFYMLTTDRVSWIIISISDEIQTSLSSEV